MRNDGKEKREWQRLLLNFKFASPPSTCPTQRFLKEKASTGLCYPSRLLRIHNLAHSPPPLGGCSTAAETSQPRISSFIRITFFWLTPFVPWSGVAFYYSCRCSVYARKFIPYASPRNFIRGRKNGGGLGLEKAKSSRR